MESLGTALREARVRRRQSLEDAEQATKVRRAFLQALEEERWDRLPARAYTQGLLASYARYLGIDPAELVAMLPPEDTQATAMPTPLARSGPLLPPWPIVAVLLLGGVIALTVYLAQGLGGTSIGFPSAGEAPSAALQETATPGRAPSITVITPTRPATDSSGGTSPTAPASPQAATATPAALATPTAVATTTPQVTTAPNVVGQTWPQVLEQLRAFAVTPLRQEQFSDSVPQEQVISQVPDAGEPLTEERTLTVVVSLGRQGTTVPNVVGRPEAEARAALTQAGLSPGRFANYQGRSDLPDAILRSVCVGCVLSTSPGAGSQLPPGGTVFLAVRKE